MTIKKKKATEKAAKVLRPHKTGKVTRSQAIRAVKAALKKEGVRKQQPTLNIRLPVPMLKRLRRLSKKTKQPMSHYAKEGIERTLIKYEKKIK